MYAVVKKMPTKGAEYCEVERPIIKDDEVLIKVLTTSICGTDLQVYNSNDWVRNRINLPHVLGHEFAGRIVEMGKGVNNNYTIDDLVTAETHIYCNTCKPCKEGKKHVCKDHKILGVDTNGSFAEYIAVPAQNLWKVDGNIPLHKACLYEPLGNAVHLVSSLEEDISDKSIGVFGCGPAGLLSIAVAKAFDVKELTAFDIEPYRLELAKKVGADYVGKRNEDGKEFDIVFEMSGSQNATDECIKSVSHGGIINWFGIPSEKIIEMNHAELIAKGIETNYITGRMIWDTWEETDDLINELNLDPIITHVLKLKDFKKGMELMKSRKCGKIILEVSQDESR